MLTLLLCGLPATAQDDAALDDLLNIPTRPAPAEAPPADGAPREAVGGTGQLQPEVRRLVEEGDPADMLDAALRQMEGVSLRLVEALDAGLDTQREQESILRKLDQVIAAARQQQEGSSGGSGGSSGGQQARQQDVGGNSVALPGQQQPGGQQGQPAGQQGASEQAGAGENRGETGAAGRPPGDPRDEPLEELRKEWGNLPPRLRNELTEGLSEEFSPAYRELTEQYYRALAEEE